MGWPERRPHDAPTFTIRHEMPHGTVYERVHCAMCGVRPDGHEADGTPRYRGGFVYATIDGNSIVAACRCAFGEAYHERTRAAHFDELPPLAIIEDPAPIVQDDGMGFLAPTAREVIEDDDVRRVYFPNTHDRFYRPKKKPANPVDFNERAEARREDWGNE